MGYDIHRLVAGRKLILGGVAIPFGKGLLGHSDADVLTHAVCDALLGAAGLGDIGRHFPDTSSEFKGISSLVLLARTVEMVYNKKFEIVNIDTTVFAQAPKIAPHEKEMKQRLADTIGIDPGRINIKATTTEGLGVIGREEGIGAMAVALLKNETDSGIQT